MPVPMSALDIREQEVELCRIIAHLTAYARCTDLTEITRTARSREGPRFKPGEALPVVIRCARFGALAWNGLHRRSQIWLCQDWQERLIARVEHRPADLDWLWPERRPRPVRTGVLTASGLTPTELRRSYDEFVWHEPGETDESYVLRLLADMGAEAEPVKVRELMVRNSRRYRRAADLHAMLGRLGEPGGPVERDESGGYRLRPDWRRSAP